MSTALWRCAGRPRCCSPPWRAARRRQTSARDTWHPGAGRRRRATAKLTEDNIGTVDARARKGRRPAPPACDRRGGRALHGLDDRWANVRQLGEERPTVRVPVERSDYRVDRRPPADGRGRETPVLDSCGWPTRASPASRRACLCSTSSSSISMILTAALAEIARVRVVVLPPVALEPDRDLSGLGTRMVIAPDVRMSSNGSDYACRRGAARTFPLADGTVRQGKGSTMEERFRAGVTPNRESFCHRFGD